MTTTLAPPVGDLTATLVETSTWTDAMVAEAGIPIFDVPFVTVGGGLGSFAMADTLRIAGVPATHIKVLTTHAVPYENYRQLATNSQIPDGERLRSDSASVMDNIWGFPSYAFREAFHARSISQFVAPLWNVLTEPIFVDYFTPKAGQVYESVDREAARIGWRGMLALGQVRMVRRRHGGGYFTVLTPPSGAFATRRIAYRCTYVHIAVGYPSLRFLDDLQEYRQKYRDLSRVVNAYEPHEHVYDELVRKPGVVVIRGSGVVASRVLQRLIDDRDKRGAQTVIWHLFRNYVAGPEGPPFFRRKGGDGFAYQGFNFCKAAWGGQIKERLAKLEGHDRSDFIRSIGGTNTPKRKLWQGQLARGRKAGFYRTHIGEVEEVVPGPGNTVVTRIRSAGDAFFEIPANFIIDATGLEGNLRDHRVFADLLDNGGAGTNPAGRLDVDPSFAVRGTASPPGKMFASGTMTLGGYYAPVDSFLGLQYAALAICDDLARLGFGRRIGVGRSISQWWRWARNRPI